MPDAITGQPAGQEPAAGAPAAGAAPQAPAAGAPAAGTPGAEHPATVTIEAPWTGKDGVYKIGEGDKAQAWYNAIPEEPVRELMKAKNYANPNELAMAYHNLNKLQNGAPDVLPAPNWDDPKSVDAFYNKLGRPETADKYELKIPEGVQPDEKFLKVGKEIFHKLGATPAAAQQALEHWEGFVTDYKTTEMETERVENDKAISALETKWGAQLEANRAAGQRAVKALGIDNALIEKVEANIGSAAIVELLAAIGNKSKEGAFVGNGSNNSDPNNPEGMSAEQAKARITALQGDSAFQAKYTDKNHAEHKDSVELMERLFAKANSTAGQK